MTRFRLIVVVLAAAFWTSLEDAQLVFGPPRNLGDDFWMSTRPSPSAPWAAAVHLGPDINTPGDEVKADFSSGGRTLLFASTRPGGRGALDIWEIPITIGSLK